MKIHIANYEPSRIGGGWTFARNLAKGFGEQITNYEDSDIYFVSSPSMVNRDDVLKAKEDGKKVVLRIDNAVRNSRNRNTGMTRMHDFAEWADLVIFQSYWAADYLNEFLHLEKFAVIHNGVDLNLYSENKNKAGDIVLYSRFNRDETKNYEVARYWFSRYAATHSNTELWIVGQFSQELKDGNFDFYNGEKFVYRGVLEERAMAKMYYHASKFLYTYFNDACSNSLIEALVSNCEIVGDEYYRTTGGAAEILDMFYEHGRDYFSLERMCSDYLEVMRKL